MTDEELKALEEKQNNDEIDNGDIDYIQAIKDLRATTVSKEEYEKVVQEKKKLIRTFAEGEEINKENPTEPVDVDTLRKDLFGGEKNFCNYDYCKKALELRKGLMEQGKPDPFLPSGYGNRVVPTQEEINKANNTAECLQHCIDYSEGDPEVFTNELQRITLKDSHQPNRRN